MTPEEQAQITAAVQMLDLQARKARAFDWLERQNKTGIRLGAHASEGGPWVVRAESCDKFVFGHTLLEAVEKARGESE